MEDLEAQMLKAKLHENDKCGHWTLLKQVPKPINYKTNFIYWLCQCDCREKTTKIISEQTLITGKSTSCGCSRLKDLTDTYLGKLHILYKDVDKSKDRKQTYWMCQCECGNYKSIAHSKLTDKNQPTLSCGCLQKEKARETNRKYNTYDLSGEYGIGYTSKGEEFYFDLEDYDKIKDYCWYKNAGGYMVTHYNNYRMNRLIMDCFDMNFVVDHINHNIVDNRKNNLRICLQRNNTKNTSKRNDNTSGVTGIWKHKKRKCDYWYSEIRVDGQKIMLGKSLSFNDMVQKRLFAEWQYYGEYSPHYIPDEEMFEIFYQNPDDNKFYKCVLKNPIPLSHNDVDVEEYTYEELKAIPSSRGMGALGSSGK